MLSPSPGEAAVLHYGGSAVAKYMENLPIPVNIGLLTCVHLRIFPPFLHCRASRQGLVFILQGSQGCKYQLLEQQWSRCERCWQIQDSLTIC